MKLDFFLGLRNKFILAFLILVIFPLLISGSLAYRQSSKIITQNAYTYSLDTLKQISKNIDYYIKEMESITGFITTNEELMENLEEYHSMPELAKVEAADKINKTLLNYTGFRDELSGLYLYDMHGNYFYRKGRSPKLDYDFYSEPWYKDTLAKSGKINIIGTHLQYHVQNKPKYVFSVSRLIRNFETRQSIGVIMVDYEYSVIEKVISTESDSALSSGNLYVLDKDGKIIFNRDASLLTKNFDYEFSAVILSGEHGTLTQKINDTEMFIVYYTSPYSLWKIVNIMPLASILKDTTVIKNSILIATLICIILIFILSLEVSNGLVKPIKQLLNAMSEIEKGNLSTRLNINTRDEVKLLADGFNRMAENIKNLIERVYHAQLNQKEAQLKALQTQINPHFLYNTLESIRGVAMIEGVQSIAVMSKSLSSLFRYSIKGKEIVYVKDEIDHIKNYITIQNFRFEDKFHVEYNIDEEIYNYKILKLTLQPLVENSIQHGLENKKGTGIIIISCKKEDDCIIFLISDNGHGMPAEKMKLLNESLAKDVQPAVEMTNNNKSESIGIYNVNTRLKLYFGNKFGLRFLSNNGPGITVEVRVPVIREESVYGQNSNS
ncbi:MAG TPA: histidine kinase [Clostridiaceae bacterium]|nr:histidine kinase [Clostridiaceae bacterium]